METRAGKYGRNLAIVVSCFFVDEDYKQRFLEELRKYSLKPRKKHEPRVRSYELVGIETIDVNNPEELARLIKEGIHLMYQKDTSRRVLASLIENL